jgi:predicted dehydrogenase
MINVGFIGCGRIADLHYLGYVDNPEARLVAVCDSNAELVERRQRERGVPKSYTNYCDLLADADIDAVEVITPQTIHEPIVIDAARARKHIACQKPMTVSLDAAERMIAETAKAGVTFKVTDNYLFYPPLTLAKRMIEDGVIGEPITMRMKFIGGLWSGGWQVPTDTWAWRIEEIQNGRGIQTFDHGHHMWATAWRLMGEFERVVSWIDWTVDFIDCPAVIMWKHKGKRYGVCDYAQATDLAIPSKYYSCDEWFEVTGSRGMILVRRCTGNVLDGPAVSTFTNDGWQHHEVESDWASGFQHATRNFIAAIKGEEEPLMTGEQALHILRFAFALRKSSDLRREVSLDEIDTLMES